MIQKIDTQKLGVRTLGEGIYAKEQYNADIAIVELSFKLNEIIDYLNSKEGGMPEIIRQNNEKGICMKGVGTYGCACSQCYKELVNGLEDQQAQKKCTENNKYTGVGGTTQIGGITQN